MRDYIRTREDLKDLNFLVSIFIGLRFWDAKGVRFRVIFEATHVCFLWCFYMRTCSKVCGTEELTVFELLSISTMGTASRTVSVYVYDDFL